MCGTNILNLVYMFEKRKWLLPDEKLAFLLFGLLLSADIDSSNSNQRIFTFLSGFQSLHFIIHGNIDMKGLLYHLVKFCVSQVNNKKWKRGKSSFPFLNALLNKQSESFSPYILSNEWTRKTTWNISRYPIPFPWNHSCQGTRGEVQLCTLLVCASGAHREAQPLTAPQC